MKLTERELWLIGIAFSSGSYNNYKNPTEWLEGIHYKGITINEALAIEAPRDTAVEDFLARTGQYVTNDASRQAAIDEAVAAERDSIIARVKAIPSPYDGLSRGDVIRAILGNKNQ